MTLRIAAWTACVLAPFSAWASMGHIELASHRAAYELALYNTGQRIGSRNGRRSACDGIAVGLRIGHVTNQELAFIVELDGSDRVQLRGPVLELGIERE